MPYLTLLFTPIDAMIGVFLQIGEISLMKEMKSAAENMSEEEKAELEKEMNGGQTPPTPSAPGFATPPHPAHTAHIPSEAVSSSPAPDTPRASTSIVPSSPATPGEEAPPASIPSPDSEPALNPASAPASGSGSPSTSAEGDKKRPAPKKRGKVTPEQRKKAEEHDRERKRAMDERIKILTTKLVDRLRPFVEAQHPGDKDDAETKAFEEKIRKEADDLKLESFGVEVRSRSITGRDARG